MNANNWEKTVNNCVFPVKFSGMGLEEERKRPAGTHSGIGSEDDAGSWVLFWRRRKKRSEVPRLGMECH